MKVSSRKAKGRRLQDSVVLKFRDLFDDIFERDDITPAIMGESGTDVVLSPSAKKIIAFDVECKNNESIINATMKNALEQTETNTSDGRIPLLVFKKNHEPERVILKLDDFLKLIYPGGDVTLHLTAPQKVIVELERLKQMIITMEKNGDKPIKE